jgi:hypothetical protein
LLNYRIEEIAVVKDYIYLLRGDFTANATGRTNIVYVDTNDNTLKAINDLPNNRVYTALPATAFALPDDRRRVLVWRDKFYVKFKPAANRDIIVISNKGLRRSYVPNNVYDNLYITYDTNDEE